MILSIIIVSWNVLGHLKHCLDSIRAARGGVDVETIVVDNASEDGSQEFIKNLEEKENIRVILNNINKGFATAVNQGIRESRGRYILLLNTDAVLEPDTLKTMLTFMDANPDVGIAGCKMFNADGSLQPSVRKFPDLASQALILLKLHRLVPSVRLMGRYFAKDFDYDSMQDVEQVMGAFFIIRRSVIEGDARSISAFDEKFFCWFEEVDYCKRARNAGWRIVYNPNASVIHEGGQGFKQLNPLERQHIFNSSMRHYFAKHGPIWSVPLLWFLHPFSMGIALVGGFLLKKRV